jgi:hypothetical protein
MSLSEIFTEAFLEEAAIGGSRARHQLIDSKINGTSR